MDDKKLVLCAALGIIFSVMMIAVSMYIVDNYEIFGIVMMINGFYFLTKFVWYLIKIVIFKRG